MTGLLILLAAIFTGCSCYYLSCAFADIPTVRTSKAMMTTRKQTGSGSEKLFDVYLTRIARLLAPVIRLPAKMYNFSSCPYWDFWFLDSPY